MTENLFDQPNGDYSLDETLDQNNLLFTESGSQQTPVGGNQVLPPNTLSQQALFNDDKEKPLSRNPKARAAAAQHLIQNRLPTPRNLQELVERNKQIMASDPMIQYGVASQTPYRTEMVRRYDDQDYGFIPGIDNDDFYGQRESWYETTGKGLLRIPTYIATKVLQGAGLVGGILSPWNWGTEEGVISKAADNSLFQVMDSFDNFTKNEWMPTFQEAADRDKGFFNRMFTDGDFWAEDAVDGVAFMVSAFVPGMALSKLAVGARTMALLGNASRAGATALGVSIEGAEAIGNYFSKAQQGAKMLDQFNSWALATTSEAMFEAKEVRDKVRETLEVTQKPDGSYYTMDEIKKIQGDAAKNTFLSNAILLGATNVFQMKYFMKPALSGGVSAAGGLGAQATLAPTESALKYYSKVIGGGIAREGFVEENLQLAIQRVNERYGTEGKLSSIFDMGRYRDILEQYGSQTVSALRGDDKEASTSIGLGAILGGGSNVFFSRQERADKKLSAEAALNGYNNAQQNWLKFGNIYKTEEVKTTDANGNETVSTRIVLDANNQPIVDDDKLTAAVTGIDRTSTMLIDADGTKNKAVRDYLRLSAFSEFVQAHINAGLETSLMEKLDGLKKASPEDLAKLGFAAGENLAEDIEKHKSIAGRIMKQNKILNENILFDDSKEDRARKSYLTELAAKQVITKEQLSYIDQDYNETKNQLLTSESTSLSDGLVDQLNELMFRISAHEQYMKYIQESGRENHSPMGVYKKFEEELKENLKKLQDNNPETLKLLKKDANGFYQYEKDDRNDFITRQFLDYHLQRRAQVMNSVKLQGLQWAYYADNKDGKKNFMTNFNNEVEFINEQKRKQEEQEKKTKEEEEAKKKAEEEAAKAGAGTQPGAGSQPSGDQSGTQNPPTGSQPGTGTGSQPQGGTGSGTQTGSGTAPGTEGSSLNDPGLRPFLKEKYDQLLETMPEFKIDFETWINSGDANFFIKEYNRKFGKNEPTFSNSSSTSTELDDNAKQSLIDSLSLADTTAATLEKASKAVKAVLDKLGGDGLLINSLLKTIDTVKDELSRLVLRSIVTGEQVSVTTPFISLQEAGLIAPMKEHVGFSNISMKKDQFQTGFQLAGNEALLDRLNSDFSILNTGVRIVATREFVNNIRKQLESAGIPNRTLFTYETPSEITKKLKQNVSVIAVSSRPVGFGVQVFPKGLPESDNLYIKSIENYAIVHSDNRTESITYSEEQREFVKANMLIDGKQMTDEDYTHLQGIYNKVQQFNEEVELVLGNNESIDITPIFDRYFTISKSGRFAQKKDTVAQLAKMNPETLFRVMYQTESGEVLEKDVPLLTQRDGKLWRTDFFLMPGETLVYQDETTGEILPVTDRRAYMNSVHGINPVFTEEFKGGVVAWLAKDPKDPKGFKPLMLRMDRGSEPIAGFKKFSKEIKELRKTLEEGAVTKEFNYKGKKYSTVNQLMKAFNMNVFGFYRYNDWVMNLSYNPDSKTFAIEFRPLDTSVRDRLTPAHKQALNLYFSDKKIQALDSSATDEEVLKSYVEFVQLLSEGYDKLEAKVKNSEDPVLKEIGQSLTSYTLFHFESDQKTKVQEWYLKLNDQNKPPEELLNYLKYNVRESKPKVSVALNDKPIDPVKKEPTTGVSPLVSISSFGPTPTTSPASGGVQRPPIKKIFDDDPFMLRTEEEYEQYTEQTLNEEIQWLKKALKNSGISLRDLGSIVDSLAAKRQVLGYYKDRVIYINRVLSAVGSIYHEAFHGLFRDVMTADQRAFYLGKAKAKMGRPTQDQINKFRNDRSYFSKTNEEIVDLMAEELLAEGFRKYKLDQKEPNESWFKKFVKLIERIINFFDRNQRAIDELYNNFDQGAYADAFGRPDNSLSKEGVYALAYGRPKLVESIDTQTGETSFSALMNVPMNMEVQKELIAKLTYRVGNLQDGSFQDKFNRAVEELKADYDLEALVQSSNPELATQIRNRFENKFSEASYVLGIPVKYVLDDNLVNNPVANEYFTDPGDNQATLDFIKKEVKSKIDSLGLEAGFAYDEMEIPQDEEDEASNEKSGEFDKVNINPLMGLSKEFRSLFGIIPYKYTDPVLGVTLNKVADGNMLFNAMIKVGSDKPTDQIIPSLAKAVEMMKEDNDPNYPPLKAFADFIQSQFGIEDLMDPTSKPTRNLFLYKQFIDTFFVTELPSYIVKVTTDQQKTDASVYDASINMDVIQKYESIKFYYEQAYRRLKTPEAIAKFRTDFNALQEFIKDSLLSFLDGGGINRRESLNDTVNKLKGYLDAVNIVLPKSLLRQSLLGIYTIENENKLNPNSKQNLSDLETDQALMKQGAYLQKDFFKALSQIQDKNLENLFGDTRDKNIDFGRDITRIKLVNTVMKRSMKYVIKYDINSAISVFQNAENKNIYRYTRYTPFILISQIVREKGIQVLKDMYPVLSDWLSDNKLFDGSLENELFLENLQMSSFGGIRQDIGDISRQGVTFGNIDQKAYHLSSIVHFMNREKISSRKKNSQGKNENVEIITFKRSRTQEEGTTTNFLVTGKYTRYIDGSNVSDKFVDDQITFLKQEYNRIQREWSNRKNENAVRYKAYNDSEKGRAFQFRNFIHFFDQHKKSDPSNLTAREILKERLLEAAKDDSNISFEQALTPELAEDLRNQLKLYMDETFQIYLNALQDQGLITMTPQGGVVSGLIPAVIKQDSNEGQPIKDYGYEDLIEVLKDFHLNIEMNKRMVNQIFDGDVATGIKSTADYFKRNKAGVISGNSMKNGYFRTAVLADLQVHIPTKINPVTGETDYDLTAQSQDEAGSDTMNVLVADGQSYHTMNHRIRMMNEWGRLDATVKSLLHKAKYKKLTPEDIKKLDDRKVVLNSLKTATGGILEYYKLSEHLIDRTDVSRLVIPQGMTKDDVEYALDEAYAQIEMLEDLLIYDENNPEADQLQEEIEKIYKDEVHIYWEPRRGREKLHYLLNSMELSGVDQVFDTNASKKTTVVPVNLTSDGVTNLKPSRSITSSMFKFMQVETSGVKNKITLPTQARQLLTTYLTRLDNDVVFKNKSLKDLAKEYSQTLGQITESSTAMLDKVLLNESGEINISQLFTTMYDGLKKQGADSNTLKYFALKDGKPVHNPNLPAIKKIFTYYYFSLFNNAIFSPKVSGRSDILVSEYGYEVLYDTLDNNRVITQIEQDSNPGLYRDVNRFKTRHLGISVEKISGRNVYTVEVMIPQHLSENESEKELYLTRLTKFFSTRIPTEDKRSMIVAKVVDYLNPSYQNSIVVPQLVHILAGSDLDVDKLYSHTFEHYVDAKDIAHVFGDYSKYATESQGRFAEYIQYMAYHPSFRDLVQAELENVVAKPVFTPDFLKIADELGLSMSGKTVEELKQEREDLFFNAEILEKAKRRAQEQHDISFAEFIKAPKRDRKAENEAWRQKRIEYLTLKDQLAAAEEEVNAIRSEVKKMENTLRLAALVNVLKSKKLPVTQSEFTTYLKTNANPVLPVLNNISLQHKIDILSNEKVFNDFYVNERSTVEPFRDVATSIGASVDSVITQNSIYSIMGDSVANKLNSSNKDGIGIAASFNKFVSFAEKTGVGLNGPLIFELDNDGNQKAYADFSNTQAIRRTGQTLGMFADGAKEPIPSVLNLNPDTAGVSNVIVGMTGNLQLGLLINKVPVIEEITEQFGNDRSAVQESNRPQGGLKSRIKAAYRDRLEAFSKANRSSELFEVDDENNITNQVRKIFIKTVEPAEVIDGDRTLKAAQMNRKDVKLSHLGIEMYYENGDLVAEDIGEAYLLGLYSDIMTINSDILKLGKILNLIKNQEPDFDTLDAVLANYDYFMSGTSVFGDSVVDALSSSREYISLLKAASKMSDYSRQILIERSPLFRAIRQMLNTGLSSTFGYERASQDITDQIGKFVIINKIKNDIKEKIEVLKTKDDKGSKDELLMLQESAKYFTGDFWLDNNTLLDDLDYLSANNPGNPFVEFLKINTRSGLDFLEASSRMKLDKDIAENMINGYESLQKSKDPRTMRLSRQMFYYLLVKDGLGYGAFTFIKYLNPDLKQMVSVSDSLTEFQKLLMNQEAYVNNRKKEIKAIAESGKDLKDKQEMISEIVKDIFVNYNKLFDEFFGNKSRPGQIDWINGILNKIFSFAGNQKYVGRTPSIKTDSAPLKVAMTEAINAGVFSHIEPVASYTEKDLNVLSKAPDQFVIDFNRIAKSPDPYMDELFKNYNPFRDIITGDLSMSFRMLMSDGKGNLYKLTEIDGNSMSEQIAMLSLGLGEYLPTQGLKAVYVKLDIEGTNNLLNFGFNKADGVKLFEQTQVEDNSDPAYRTEAVVYKYNGQVISPLSDSKTKEEAPTTYTKLESKSPVPPVQGAPGGSPSSADLLSDEEADKLIASGYFKRSGKGYDPNADQGSAPPSAPPASNTINVYAGTGENAQLSNFAKRPFSHPDITNDLVFNTVEGAYQAAKIGFSDLYMEDGFLTSEGMKIYESLRTATGAQAKQIGASIKGLNRTAWDQASSGIMKALMRLSFEQNPEALKALQATGNAVLTHVGTEKPNKWTLEFPKLLMEVRSELSGIGSQQSGAITQTQELLINYTPIGKTEQTYKVVGAQIFNKDGNEVFKEESKDRNRIFANVAVKQGRAVVVEHKDNKYVVNNRKDIISVKTGDRMKWGEENGDRKAILELARKKFEAKAAPQGAQVVTSKTGRQLTPPVIESLGRNEVFVFGSNTEGRHGLGAAKTANEKFGAKYFQPEGLQGQSYAIVTKNLKAGTQFKGETFNETGKRSVPLRVIGKGVQDMIVFAKNNPQLKFFVTKFGSSLAGYSEEEIRGVFERLKKYIPDNVILPAEYEVRDEEVSPTGSDEITLQDIDEVYRSKTRSITLEEFRKQASEYVKLMTEAGMRPGSILEQVKCL